MDERRKAFIEGVKERIGNYKTTKEDVRVTDIAEAFYESLRGGKIEKHVTQGMVLYTHTVLPKLSFKQVSELTHYVHTLVKTVLSYLVEDGIIKEA